MSPSAYQSSAMGSICLREAGSSYFSFGAFAKKFCQRAGSAPGVFCFFDTPGNVSGTDLDQKTSTDDVQPSHLIFDDLAQVIFYLILEQAHVKDRVKSRPYFVQETNVGC